MDLQVFKENEHGSAVWQYPGKVLKRTGTGILIEARFNKDDFDFHGFPFCKGDRFLEAYFSKQWFNIYEIYQGETSQRKGWYCNITYPAVIYDTEIHYRDLALDVLIFADRRHLLLDEDEFETMSVMPEIKEKARKIPQELLSLFERFEYQSIQDWFDFI